MKKGKLLKDLKKIKWWYFILLTVAGFINSFGVTVFLAPVKLYDSGISGTSMLLSQITPEWMSLSVFLLILNIPLFILGYKKQGLPFTLYSLYAVGVYSLGAWLITDVLPIDVSMASPLAGDDLLLCAIFGGLISGVGSGLTIRFGGAIDGIEVMAVIFAKKTEYHSRHILYDLQCHSVHHLRFCQKQLDSVPLLNCYLCCRTEDG